MPCGPTWVRLRLKRVVGEGEGIAGLGRRGQPAEIVVAVSDVGLAAGEVLERQPAELVVGEGDLLCVAQAAVGDVAVGVVAELLIVGRDAGVGALGRQRESGLRQPVVAVIFIGGEVVLGVRQGLRACRCSYR